MSARAILTAMLRSAQSQQAAADELVRLCSEALDQLAADETNREHAAVNATPAGTPAPVLVFDCCREHCPIQCRGPHSRACPQCEREAAK